MTTVDARGRIVFDMVVCTDTRRVVEPLGAVTGKAPTGGSGGGGADSSYAFGTNPTAGRILSAF